MDHLWGKITLAALVLFTASESSAVVIADTNIRLNSRLLPDSNYDVEVSLSPDRLTGWQGCFFWFDGTSLQYTGLTPDVGAAWYLVNEGVPFTDATIASGQFPSFQVFNPEPVPVSIPHGSFYLAVLTAQVIPGQQEFPRNVFGWIHLNNTGTSLEPLGNAVSYGDGGIIVGTTTAAPEPSAIGIASVFCAGSLGRRRSGVV